MWQEHISWPLIRSPAPNDASGVIATRTLGSTEAMGLSRRPRRFARRGHASGAAEAPGAPGAFHAPVRLADRVANWPRGTPVTIVEPFGPSVMVEVADAGGDTLDVLVVRPELLTV